MGYPLLVEIIAYAPTAFYHCTHCEVAWKEMGVSNHFHDEQVQSSLPVDLAQEYQAISDWVREVFRLHCDRVVVKVIDATSLEGFFKTFRYKAHQLPVVIIDQTIKFSGGALEQAGQEITRQLEARQAIPA